ncbi:MAG: hypothetical protein OXM57_02800 [bacterium]|nr:hypothetical protein [bacterium]MDE0351606.1 hypothetical protein [bacterium]
MPTSFRSAAGTASALGTQAGAELRDTLRDTPADHHRIGREQPVRAGQELVEPLRPLTARRL